MNRLRLATAADFRAYTGRDPDPLWCEQWFGFAAEDGGELVGLGIVSRDDVGRIWVWSDMRRPLSAFLLHRAVRSCFGGLQAAGVTALHAYCSDKIPGAARWLRRLGFRPDPTLPEHDGKPVYTCTLSS